MAEMRANEIIRARDMALHGLGALHGQTRELAEVVDAYLVDLATRTSPAHVVNSRQALARMMDELKVRRVMDLRPFDVLQARARLLESGLAPRSSASTARGVHMRSCSDWPGCVWRLGR